MCKDCGLEFLGCIATTEKKMEATIQDLGFPKIRGTILGFPIIRITMFWGLDWGPPNERNHHLGFGVTLTSEGGAPK